MLANFFQALRQPEYIHVLINPLPVYGLAIAVIGLIIALLQRSRPAQVATLALILLCGALAWPVMHYGEAGKDIAISLSDEEGQKWLEAHEHRAEKLVWAFYVLAGLAAAAILAPMQWPQTSTALAIVTLVCSFAVLGIGGYIGYAGGKVRHREFRNEPAPTAPADHHEH